jgi:putative DNA primase/helicase
MYFVMTGSTITGTREVIADIHNTVIEAITLSHTIEKPQTKQRGTTTPKSKTPPLTHTTEGGITILPAPSNAPIYPAWVDTEYQKILNRALDLVKNSSDSNHHDTRFRAGRLIGGALERAKNDGYIYDENITATLIYNASTIRAGEERKGMTAILDGIEIGRQEPLPPEPIPLTDLGNAQRFYNAWGKNIRYVLESKVWIYWNGRVWERLEGDDLITQLAHKTARSITEEELPAITDTDKRKIHIKWGMASEGAGRIKDMVRSMRPYVGIPANALDTHNHLLCVQNGVVNLKTGALEPHNPNYYITKMVPIDYAPGAPAPHWERFLHTVFEGDTDLIHWIQMVMGYTLTGSTDERCLFFLYGVGKNGKSIFFEVLRMLLVDHLKVTSIEALLQTEQTVGATPYVADLQGARCAIASEMPQGKRFNESLLKTLTGGDTLTARMVFGNPFSFRPTHTLWVSGNYLPRVQSDDPAIWERVRIIPFKNIIQNPRPAGDLLGEFTSEQTGILSWVIEGSGLWYEEGKLPINPTVANATSEYRGQEDIYALFISECCILKPGAQTLKSGVYKAFQLWGIREGDKKTIEAITQRMLTEKLIRKGIDIGGSGRMYYIGVVLTDYNHSDEEGN